VLTPKSKVKGEAVVQAEGLALPGWAVAPAPIESRPSRPLTPTAPRDDDLPYPPPLPAMRVAAERGRLLHSLFERLPDVPAERRRDAAIRWLEGQGADVALADEALGVMDDPALAALFDGEALAEAPIAAVVGEDVVSGVAGALSAADGGLCRGAGGDLSGAGDHRLAALHCRAAYLCPAR
jgi:ATP-dependent helicase/nuclease subunit A